MLIAFNKPFGVACKFSPEPGRKTLADFITVKNVYPAGRLDTDSEGLLLVTDDGVLQARIAEPKHDIAKVYWAQVEGVAPPEALDKLRVGVTLGDFTTRPARAALIEEPRDLWPRDPPIRFRAKNSDLLDRACDTRRQESPSSTHDGRGWISYAASDPRCHRQKSAWDGLAPGSWREIDADAPWSG